MGLLGDIISGIAGGVTTGYQIYQDQRDFDYQKALQNTIFQREDTAVQRRKNDLLAAGMNPNLAMGDGAGAGSVVGRSTGQAVDFGSALDAMKAHNQIELEKQEVENKKVENENLRYQSELLENELEAKQTENAMNLYTNLYEAGFEPTFELVGDYKGVSKGGEHYSLKVNPNLTVPKGRMINRLDEYGNLVTIPEDNWYAKAGNKTYYKNFHPERNRLKKRLDYEYGNLVNSAALLQNDVDWYTARAIAGIASDGISAGAKAIQALRGKGPYKQTNINVHK